MKTVFLVRHAKSSWDDASLSDIDRPLNERGAQDAPRMAQLLKDKGIKPSLLISSPANRALSTALVFAEAFGIPPADILVDDDIYEAYVDDIIDIIRDLPASARTVLLFGHNPTFTHVANMFSKRYIDNIPTCGIVQIEAQVTSWANFTEDRGELVDFYFPKQL